MVTTATTFGQTATRNDWTTGISKSQHTYAQLTAEGIVFHNFSLVFLLQLDELRRVLADRSWLSTNTTVIMSTYLALSTSITCKTAICSAASKLREDAFHPFRKPFKGPSFALNA